MRICFHDIFNFETSSLSAAAADVEFFRVEFLV